jgi:MFS family permease
MGVALALLFALTVREPRRRVSHGESAAAVPILAAICTLARISAFRWMLAGASFLGGALYASGTWTTSMLVRVHGLSVTEVAAVVTPLRGIAGAVGIVLTGWLADRLGRRDPRWRLWVPAIACLICVPAFAIFLLGSAPAAWIIGLAIVSALHPAYQGPTFAAVIAMAPAPMRAIAVAIVVMFTGLVSQIFGPLVVGVLNDALSARYGAAAIRYSLLVVPIATLLGALCFLMVARRSQSSSALGA